LANRQRKAIEASRSFYDEERKAIDQQASSANSSRKSRHYP
ncbi:hypothetical protein HMPREF1981_02621, partial [Bacteroides pyogenes F0041]